MESVNPPKPHLIPRRGIRLNVGLQILAAIILAACANYFAFNHYARWDFSRSQKFSLASKTRAIIKQLKKPVKITVCFSPTLISAESQIFPDVQNLLKEFQFSGRNLIEIEYVDPTRNPSRARDLQGKYKFSFEENVLIVDYDGRTKFIPASDMADFDLTPMTNGDPPRLLAFKGEQALGNAMLGLVDPERRTVYFMQGHGEPPTAGLTPLSVFKDYIERQNVRIETLNLSSADSIPADCAALFIISPQFDLDARETVILSAYWQSRGRVLVLLDPKAKVPNLSGVLSQAGITPRDDRVLRTVRLPFATGILRDVTGQFLETSEITKRLVGTSLLFPGATQSLNLSEPENITVRPLIQAAEEFWGEKDYVTDESKGVRYEQGRDTGYPITLAASADRGGVQDDRVEVKSARMIVVGNSEFILDASLTQQGLDFILSAANSLLDRGKLAGVTPKSSRQFLLKLTNAQMGGISLYTMILIPGTAALLGILVWWRRRA